MQKEQANCLPANRPDAKNLVPAMILVGIAINLFVGSLVAAFKVPIFVDAVGTILVTLLLGIRAGIVTGVLSLLIGGLLINSVMFWFAGTQAAIAIYVGWMARARFFRSVLRVVICGIGLGMVAAIVSAPIIVKVFGGMTDHGSGASTEFFLAAGESIVRSVFLTGLWCEPLDKTVQCLLAFGIIRSLPKNFLSRFAGRGYLENSFAKSRDFSNPGSC